MSPRGNLREKAEALRALHVPGRPLLLPNAWDAATARVLEEAGFPAVATTSAGIAFAAGYPDGEEIPVGRMLEAVAGICEAVSVPVSADMEAGYGDAPADVDRMTGGLLDAGAVGLNLEDGGREPRSLAGIPAQLAKIRAVREAGARRGVPVVVNARTDVYLSGWGAEADRFEEAARRGEAYRDAGADCVFVPGVIDEAVIGALARRLACPINVLAGAGSPSIGVLASLGVARVSLGSGPMRAAMSLLERLAEELKTSGTYSALEGIVSHKTMNDRMARN